MTRILRFVIFSPSIISDIGNPQATTVRAMCEALILLGHDVTHIEPRGNEHLTRMLAVRGYAPMRALNERYPLLRYKQYDPAGGIARRIWFSREIGTADAVVAYPGCRDDVMAEVQDLDSPRILTFWPEATGKTAEILNDWFEPAVCSHASDGERIGTLAVAYGDAIPTEDTARRFCCGTFDDPEWTYVPEVNLPDMYRGAGRVRLNATDVAGDGYARALLPVASGATTELVDADGAISATTEALSPGFDARLRAERLTQYIDLELGQRYVLPS